ncbi:hypothetical protein [Streptomyces sp. NPDC057909]|uniref:hypothetical protein n=1 Tax=Streptomyces sp. NPDC057909 TaxID=3346277 RepID=UPI0036E9D228
MNRTSTQNLRKRVRYHYRTADTPPEERTPRLHAGHRIHLRPAAWLCSALISQPDSAHSPRAHVVRLQKANSGTLRPYSRIQGCFSSEVLPVMNVEAWVHER